MAVTKPHIAFVRDAWPPQKPACMLTKSGIYMGHQASAKALEFAWEKSAANTVEIVLENIYMHLRGIFRRKSIYIHITKIFLL